MSERLYALLMGHRLAAALALVLITAALAAGMTRWQFDNSYTQWFVDDDPALIAYDDFLERFGSEEVIVVGLDTAGDPLSEATLAAVSRISRRWEEHPEVSGVWSLTHAQSLTQAGGGLLVRPLVEEIPPPPQERAWLEGEIEHGAVASTLVSADRSMTLVLLRLEHAEGSVEPKMQLVREVRAALPELSAGRQTWLTGGTVIDEAFFRYSYDDSMLYAPLMGLAVLLTLGLLFRSPVAMILPLGVVLVSVLWASGFMSWLGWRANIVTTILPPILAAVGIADSVHLLQQYRLASRKGSDDPLKSSFVKVLRPCFLTTITTSLGMLALSAAKLSGIRELGQTAAVGVLAAFLLTMVALPLALSVAPRWALGGLIGQPGTPEVPRSLVAVARFAIRRRVPVAIAGAGLVVAALAGLPRLPVGASMTSYFWEDDPVYQAGLDVDAAFGGTLPAELLIDAVGEDASLLEPEALERVDAITRYIETVTATGDAVSMVDLLREARRVLHGEPPGSTVLPSSRREAAQILLLLEGEAEIERFLTPDHRSARVSVPVEIGRYDDVVDEIPQIEERLVELSGGVVEARMTGLARLLGGMEEYLVASQITTFSLAFVLVLGCIATVFRSWRAGLISIVPNLFPLAIVLGLMGWAGIRLDLTTVMLAPLLLGLVVDDTVHVLERVLEARGEGAEVGDAFVSAVSEVGHAVVITSIVLAIGFLCPILGSFRPNFYFATVSFVAIILAVVGDLILFPAVGALLPGLVRGK